MAVNASPAAPCTLPRTADRCCASAGWPTPATTRWRRRRSRTSWVRGYRLPLRFGQASRSSGPLPCLAEGHHRWRLHDHGLAADPLRHQRGQLGIAANWQTTPQQIAFAVISTSGSSWAIAATFEDPSDVYPSPISSAPPASRCWQDRRTRPRPRYPGCHIDAGVHHHVSQTRVLTEGEGAGSTPCPPIVL